MTDHTGHFDGGSDPVSGDLSLQDLQIGHGKVLVHIRIDDTAGNGVDLDVAGSQLFCQRAGETVESALGSGVSHLHGGTHVTPDRGNVDDLAAALFQHQGNGQLTGIEAGGKIGAKHIVPVLNGHIGQKAYVGNARIVDQHIQLLYIFETFLNKFVISDVTDEAGTFDIIGSRQL